MKNKVAIIGGGASGLFAAITAKRYNPQAEVTVFEKLPRVGKKLLSTGNGRCNLSNKTACDSTGGLPLYYHGNQPAFVMRAFSLCNVEKTIEIFSELGLLVTAEDDKLYPITFQAGSVLDVLRFACTKHGVEIKNDLTVSTIKPIKNGFLVDSDFYHKVIVATGGKASPHLGSDGSGYSLLASLGHRLTKLYPAITQIKTDTTYVKQLKGIKCDAVATISKSGKALRSERGEVLFCDYGLSGPPVLQLSRIAAVEKDTFITLDLLPQFSADEIADYIRAQKQNPFYENATLEILLTGLLNKRLGQVCIKYAGIQLSNKIESLNDYQIQRIANAIKQFKVKVTGVQGFANAQVTAGGIDTSDFDPETMESKLVSSLYAIGEVLDIDGDCGGYNLQWAFSSGYVAGKHAAGVSK